MSKEVLQIAEKRKAKGKGEKERYIHLNVEFQRIARRDKKVFLDDQRNSLTVAKVLPTKTWGLGKGTENPQGI